MRGYAPTSGQAWEGLLGVPVKVPHEAVPQAGPDPCRPGIGTSCASQMFLVYPQMCVANLRLPWPPHPHYGVGLGPGAL